MREKIILPLLLLYLQQTIASNELNKEVGRNRKFAFSINASYANGFVDGRSGVNDFSFLYFNNIMPGGSLGGGVRYSLNRSFSLYSGLNLIQAETIKFAYWGRRITRGATFLQVPLHVAYHFRPNDCGKSYFVTLGTIITHSNHGGSSLTVYSADDYRPERLRSSIFKSGFFPLLQLGFGWRTISKKGREVEYGFYIHKGFIPIETFTLQSFNPNLTSTFSRNGSLIKFQVNWYFKPRKSNG